MVLNLISLSTLMGGFFGACCGRLKNTPIFSSKLAAKKKNINRIFKGTIKFNVVSSVLKKFAPFYLENIFYHKIIT